ncbi:hypothetical protein QOT17_007608 [Balamuthia mandrillaris]
MEDTAGASGKAAETVDSHNDYNGEEGAKREEGAEEKVTLEAKPLEEEEGEEADRYRRERAVGEWMQNLVKEEVKRIKSAGSNAIPVPIKNTALLRKGNKIINRVEVDTGFDFNKVRQIMLSDPVPCPLKPSFFYVHVLLFTHQPIPIILPYLFKKKRKTNNLTDWMFINNKGQSSHHQVQGWSDVY